MQYTNEELAAKIQAGQTGYTPILWEQVQAFVQQQAGRWWRAWHRNRPTLEVDDLYQCGYFALVNAVKTYKPDGGLAFIGWLKNYLLTEFTVEVGFRTAKQRGDPLNAAISMDAPIGGETEDITVGDLVADPVDRIAPIDEAVYQEQIKPVVAAALEDLPEPERNTLQCRYADGLTLKDTGMQLGYSATYTHELECKALRKLRSGSHIQELSEAYYLTKNLYNGTGFAAWDRTGSSAQEAFVIGKEQKEAKLSHMKFSDDPEERIQFYINELHFTRELAEMIVECEIEA